MLATDNSLKQFIIGILILLFTGAVMGATGWNFTQVSSIPENYMKKTEIRAFIERNRQDHKDIEHKLDRLLELILQLKMENRLTNSSIVYSEEDR